EEWLNRKSHNRDECLPNRVLTWLKFWMEESHPEIFSRNLDGDVRNYALLLVPITTHQELLLPVLRHSSAMSSQPKHQVLLPNPCHAVLSEFLLSHQHLEKL